jgi:predicted FMN-binding regulatory protein PaiB
LSQNKAASERQRVIEGLQAAGETRLVALMQAALEKA